MHCNPALVLYTAGSPPIMTELRLPCTLLHCCLEPLYSGTHLVPGNNQATDYVPIRFKKQSQHTRHHAPNYSLPHRLSTSVMMFGRSPMYVVGSDYQPHVRHTTAHDRGLPTSYYVSCSLLPVNQLSANLHKMPLQ